MSERPHVAYEANDCGYYSQSDAGALFKSLEAELQVTKTALELCAKWYTEGNRPQEVVDYYIEKARKEGLEK